MNYERYIHTVLVPHVVVTAIIFWGMVIAWLFGWMPFNDALLVAVIGIAVLLAHGAVAAVWSVSAAANDKTQIDAVKPSLPLDKPLTEPKPALTIDKPATEPKPTAELKAMLNVDRPPVVLKRPAEETPKIVPLPAVETLPEAPKSADVPSVSAASDESAPTPEAPKSADVPSVSATSDESAPPTADNPVADSATPKQTP